MNITPGTRLGPYEILSPIGAGGMGEVWKARDTRLGRIVAIKKVREQHSERFKQEARTIAALNHPNICQLFDIGDDYLVLEYVEGKSLSSPLPERESVRLAIQICSALEAAHRKGIIHRDLKPSNIMVTDKGFVKLLDFGLAKLYEQNAEGSQLPTADYPATEAGAILGTVAYMSPEQAQGQAADARSDIFSFGLVLYEMLSGRRAFSGDTPLVIGSALMKEEPLPLQTSSSLERIVQRCIAKLASARYQAISEVKTALEQISREIEVKASAEPEPSIAVLPFVNMSGDKEQEYFSDGLAEEIINALTHIPGLKVIARTSAFAFKGKQEDITKIAEALRVSTILEGSVRKAGNRIRVTAQLITAADGSHLWSERYDRDMTDVFGIQDEISKAIAEKLRVRLSGDRPLVKRQTRNLEAYNLYLTGRHHFIKYTLDGIEKSKKCFEKAIELDPEFALAWFGLAHYYHYMTDMGLMLPRVALAKCRKATMKCLELDATLPQAHAMMGALWAGDYEWQEAEREFHRALQLGPETVEAFGFYGGFYLLPMRRLDEAVECLQKAIELNPLAVPVHAALGFAYLGMRQYERAIDRLRAGLELDPRHPWAQMNLGVCFVLTERFDEGIRTCEMAAQLPGRHPLSLAVLGTAYALAGQIPEARKLLEELKALTVTSHVPAIAFGLIHFCLGEIDSAVDWFEKAIEERDPLLASIQVYPYMDPLRSHPRYHALLRKMNLEP